MGGRVAASIVVALAVAGSAGAARKPVVPVAVQLRIAAQAPAVAYVPARVSPPWRYRNWAARGGILHIWFASRTEPSKVIEFVAEPFRGSCRDGEQKSFQMAGVKTWWSHTTSSQQSWRCVHGRKLIARTTMGLRRYADVGLAAIVASGHRIR